MVKSRRRTTFAEFANELHLGPDKSPEYKTAVLAGFRTWLSGDLNHFDDEWQELWTQYNSRSIGERRSTAKRT